MRRILGIDPGSTATGFAVIEGDGAVARLIDSGVIVLRDSASNVGRLSRKSNSPKALDDARNTHCNVRLPASLQPAWRV